MSYPENSYQAFTIRFLFIFLLLFFSLNTLAVEKFFKTFYTPAGGEPKLIHQSKITSEPVNEGDDITQLTYETESGSAPPTITIEPSEEQTYVGDISIGDNVISDAVLLDDLLTTTTGSTAISEELPAGTILWVNAPLIHSEGLPYPVGPAFQVTGLVIDAEGDITIQADTLSCTNCPCEQCPGVNEGNLAGYCANCDCCQDEESAEEDKPSAKKAPEGVTEEAQKEHEETEKKDEEGTAKAEETKAADVSDGKEKCQGGKRAKAIIKLSKGNGSVSSISLNTPAGTTTVVLTETEAPAPDNTAILSLAGMFVTLHLATSQSSSSGATP